MSNSLLQQADQLVQQFCVAMKGAPSIREVSQLSREAADGTRSKLRHTVGKAFGTAPIWEYEQAATARHYAIEVSRKGFWYFKYAKPNGGAGFAYRHAQELRASNFSQADLDQLKTMLEWLLEKAGREQPW